MLPVRQSTAFETAIGPVLDADGVAVTGCVVGDFKLKKTTGNFAALNGSATLTHVSAGVYDLVLTTSDTDTVGLCCVAIDDTVNACASIYLQVMEEVIYDAMYAASANAFSGAAGSTTLTALASGSITAAVIATGAIDADAIADNAIDAGAIASDAITAAKIASDAITAAKIATGAITSAKFAAGAIDAAAIANSAIDAATFAADVDAEILSYLVDDATRIDASALNTATGTTIPAILDDTDLIDDGTSGLAKIATDVAAILVDTGTDIPATLATIAGYIDTEVASLTTELAKVPKSDGTATWNATALASIQTEANDALVANNLDHLVLSAVDTDFATTVHVDSVVGQIAQTADGGFSRATDSNEAIRDRGDAAWVTATGFSTLSQADVRSAVGLASANLDTQLGDLPTNAELATSQAAADDATLAAIAALSIPTVAQILTTQMTESYAADGTAPTLAQALFLIQQQLGDFSISGTTLTVKKLDGSTTAATFTLNDGTSPTSLTRAS